MTPTQHICMLAAENDVIPGAKVGGIGDVVRDIPRALAQLPHNPPVITTIIPSYGRFHTLPDAQPIGRVMADFRGVAECVDVYEIYKGRDTGISTLVIHHPFFAAGGEGVIYCDDDASQPFATDANKFALFCVAALSVIKSDLLPPVDVLHLHDWHAALAAVLLRFHPAFDALRSITTVFSIHNMALQGIRPFIGHPSALQSWYPGLQYDADILADSRWPDCINPPAAAIRLCDRVHTVSPSYADEIVQPNQPERGFHGGEGLENDLQQAKVEGRLTGIINGIDYKAKTRKLAWPALMEALAGSVLSQMTRHPQLRTVDYLAHQRLLQWSGKKRPAHILTSVGRLTAQKVTLLLKKQANGESPLQQLLDKLDGRGILLLLGSGDKDLEQQCCEHARHNERLIFINQYSGRLSDLLFSHGDLFLMPSSFEPCGISQMLAMRAGQPCLAHAVGGLKDTIDDNNDGFLFAGDSTEAQISGMLERLDDVLTLREKKPAAYKTIAATARQKRFDWQNSALRYQKELYK